MGDRAVSSDRVGRYVGWFAPRLRELRAKAGLTQAELARRAGVSQPRVAEYEGGRYAPTWEAVVRLALALEVSADAFLREPEETPPKKIRDPD